MSYFLTSVLFGLLNVFDVHVFKLRHIKVIITIFFIPTIFYSNKKTIIFDAVFNITSLIESAIYITKCLWFFFKWISVSFRLVLDFNFRNSLSKLTNISIILEILMIFAV